MFNPSDILRSAWAQYRAARPAFYARGDETGKRMFLRYLFANMLRQAWAEAKNVVPVVAQFRAAERRAQTTKAVAMDPMARSARISAIRDELTLLDYAPLGMRTSHRRHDLGAELSILTQASA